MQDFQKILKLLTENKIKFVLIGGLAATAHGSSLLTEDIDFCISFDEDNMRKLLKALDDIHPEHRLIGKAKPLDEDFHKLSLFKNLYLKTDVGYIDFLSRVSGIGDYDDAKKVSVEMLIFNMPCMVLDIDALIKTKEEMGRSKDKETIIQLKAIREKKGDL